MSLRSGPAGPVPAGPVLVGPVPVGPVLVGPVGPVPVGPVGLGLVGPVWKIEILCAFSGSGVSGQQYKSETAI